MSDVTQLSDYRPQRKQLDVTDAMLEQIQFVADSAVTADDVVVFEATALNTLPLNKAGSIFEDARVTRATLTQMAEGVNSKEHSVPLHTLHLQGEELPVGRVFHAYVQDLPNGQSELRAQFYLSRSESELIEKMNLGILDEVSVGVKSKQLLCSKCGWDYFGEDANFLHLWDRTCANDHTITVDGTHAVLSGLDSWMELSVVSRGAASKAKIHGRAKKVMPQEQQDKVAASGYEPDVVTLFASPTLSTSKQKEEEPMTDKTEAPKAPAASEAEFDAQAAFTELSANIAALTEALTAQADETDAANAAAEEAETVEDLKAQVEELKGQVAELSKPKADPKDLVADDTPAGGAAASAVNDATKQLKASNFGAFKLRK
tara:strand:+ start:2252 stop:3376 length:1125 start_codon:yes stop_codon:yes gene_type:complete